MKFQEMIEGQRPSPLTVAETRLYTARLLEAEHDFDTVTGGFVMPEDIELGDIIRTHFNPVELGQYAMDGANVSLVALPSLDIEARKPPTPVRVRRRLSIVSFNGGALMLHNADNFDGAHQELMATYIHTADQSPRKSNVFRLRSFRTILKEIVAKT